MNKTNPLNKTFIIMPREKAYQTEGIARNFSVLPANTTISGYTWYDRYGDGEFDINETIPNVPIKLFPFSTFEQSPEDIIIDSDQNGEFKIDLLPGDYSGEIIYNPSTHYYLHILPLFLVRLLK